MNDPLTFEARLADLYERYLTGAPVAVDARAAASVAATTARLAPVRWSARSPMLARLALAAVLLLGLAVGLVAIGGLLDNRILVQPTPTATPVASTATVGPITNGPLVMVVSEGDGTAQYMTVYPDRNGIASTLPIAGWPEGCPTLSPDGESLAFIGIVDGSNPRDLLVSRADGTDPRALWSGDFSSSTFHQVVWSADGGTVAATLARPGGIVIGKRDDGTGKLVGIGGGEFPGEITLSPDGRLLAKRDSGATTGGIAVNNLEDGSGRTIAVPGNIRAIAWSPNGHSIAYIAASGVGANDADVYLVGLDGSNPHALDPGSGGNEGHPVWSPDGRLLAVTNDAGYVQVFDASGAKVRRVDTGVGKLTWAPDSRSILVAIRSSLSSSKAVRVNLTTGVVTPVAGATGFYDQCPVSWGALPR